jgi:hypothetical protein
MTLIVPISSVLVFCPASERFHRPLFSLCDPNRSLQLAVDLAPLIGQHSISRSDASRKNWSIFPVWVKWIDVLEAVFRVRS